MEHSHRAGACRARRRQRGGPADDLGGWLKLLLGLGLLLVAVRQFRGRPREGEEAPLPKWMGAIDRFRAGQALGGGTALAAANPKNLLLAVGGAAAIAQTGIPASQQAIAYAVFAIIGTLAVGAPVGISWRWGSGRRSCWVASRIGWASTTPSSWPCSA
jgi:hypothetical protein